jgi:hypothetical protein
MHDDNTRLASACQQCGNPFTPEEWEDRHTDENGEDIHERCCAECRPYLEPLPPPEGRPIVDEHPSFGWRYMTQQIWGSLGLRHANSLSDALAEGCHTVNVIRQAS